METSEYDHLRVEAAARALWERHDVYRASLGGAIPPGTPQRTGDYPPPVTPRGGPSGPPDAASPGGDPRTPAGTVFSVDTPPPYVSAAHLHVGHAMSYSQPDFIVRYRRMRGDRVLYPIGFDDNGLPTERYVEQKYGVKAADMPRSEFVRLCLEETATTAAVYEELWRRLGLSVDWSLRYSTIDERSRRMAQLSFVRLHRAGHLRRASDPILWCPEDRTALAQADVEDLERTSRLYLIEFEGAGEVATTRPELLPGCVALYHHPDDRRYAGLSSGRVPLFGHEVPVRTDPAVDPGYGTGLMMVCTFGDAEDVLKWRRDQLATRLVISPDGRLNELAGEFAGLRLEAARAAIVKKLGAAGTPVRQVVGVHERCQTPVEFQIRPQWFIAVRENAAAFRRRAAELEWIPPFMRRRLEDWIDGLKWDWNITRQRHYGVPFPVWFCASCGTPVLADEQDLPVDPLAGPPPARTCGNCGSSAWDGDPDVMDTWMTSSLTPQITCGWDAEPMSMRVQAFEIIRTWLFYSIVQSELHFGRLPWRTALISGHGLNEQGRKISKRDLDSHTGEDGYNRYVPDDVMGKYGADALRVWATKGRTGADLKYNEKDIRAGRKLAVKLWNVGRFIWMYGEPAAHVPVGERALTDRWVLSHLAQATQAATEAFEEHDYMQAYQAVSRMFWSVFCDRYIEMVKDRLGAGGGTGDGTGDAARCTLREAFRTLLGLFAPFVPFVTEELYQRFYASQPSEQGALSLHLTRWPAPDPAWLETSGDQEAGDAMATILDAVRALRTEQRMGSSARLDALLLGAESAHADALLARIGEPLRVAARADALVIGDRSGHASGVDGVTVGIRS